MTIATQGVASGFFTSLGFSSTAAGIASGAVAGAAGSIASQGVGVATGIQEKFSFKGVALAAVSGAVGGGFSKTFEGLGKVGGAVARGAAGSAVTQGIAVAAGLQSKFSFAAVAGAALGAGIGAAVGDAIGATPFSENRSFGNFAANLGANTASGIANAGARSLIGGTNFGDNILAALPDIIGGTVGNAIGSRIAGQSDSGYDVGQAGSDLGAATGAALTAANVAYVDEIVVTATRRIDAEYFNYANAVTNAASENLAAYADAAGAAVRASSAHYLATGNATLALINQAQADAFAALAARETDSLLAGAASRIAYANLSAEVIGPRNTGLDVSSFSAEKLAAIANYHSAVEFANDVNSAAVFVVGTLATGGLVGPSLGLYAAAAGAGFGAAIDAGVQYALNGKVNIGQTAAAALAGALFNGGSAVAPTIRALESLVPTPGVLGMSIGVPPFGGASQVVKGEAGRFGDLAARGAIGDRLTPHHMPQAAAAFTSRADGGALMMLEAEHMLTRTYGFKGALTVQQESGMAFRNVLARDIRDVRSIAGSQYNSGLRELLSYYRSNFPVLMKK